MFRYMRKTLQLDRLCTVLAISDSQELLSDGLDNGDITVVASTTAANINNGSLARKRSRSCSSEGEPRDERMKRAKRLYQKLVLGANISDDDDLSESDEEVEPDTLWNSVNDMEEWSGDDESTNKVDLALQNLLDSEQMKRPESRKDNAFDMDLAKPIQCDECDLILLHWSDAIAHKKEKHPASNIHYACPLCSGWFPFRDLRDKHLEEYHQSQQTPPSVTCDECGVQFYSKGALGFHARTLHGNVHKNMLEYTEVHAPPPSKKVAMNEEGFLMCAYYCYLCGIEYMSKITLQQHLEKEHTEKDQCVELRSIFRCTSCDAIFWNKFAFDNHRKYHTPEDMYILADVQGDPFGKKDSKINVSLLENCLPEQDKEEEDSKINVSLLENCLPEKDKEGEIQSYILKCTTLNESGSESSLDNDT